MQFLRFVLLTTTLAIAGIAAGPSAALVGLSEATRSGVRSFNQVLLDGDFAYLRDRDFGLRIFDVSDPRQIRRAGSVDLPGKIEAMAQLPGWIFLAGRKALFVLEIREDGRARRVHEVALPDRAVSMAVSGATAYVATRNRLLAIDVSDPRTADVLGDFSVDRRITQILAEDGFVYVVGNNRFEILDVNGPSAPASVFLAEVANAFAAVVGGGVAYVSRSFDSDLVLFDVADPRNAAELGTFELSGAQGVDAVAIDAAGARLYLDSQAGMHVVDIDGPNQLTPRGVVGTQGGPLSIALRGNVAYVATGGSLLSVDLSVSDLPQLAPEGVPGDFASAAPMRPRLVIRDEMAYEAPDVFPPAFRIVDLSDPRSPVLRSTLKVKRSPLSLSVDGDRAYVSFRDFGFWVIDISDPDAPVVVTKMKTASREMSPCDDDGCEGQERIDQPAELVARDGILFIAHSVSGLRIFDARDPDAIEEIAQIETEGSVERLALEGDRIHFVGPGNGLRIARIANPARPKLVGSLKVGHTEALRVRGGLAYLLRSTRLEIVGVWDPSKPRRVGRLRSGDLGLSGTLALDGLRAAAGEFTEGIVDISDPEHPIRLGGPPQLGDEAFALAGTRVYTGDPVTGFGVIEMGDEYLPPAPNRAGCPPAPRTDCRPADPAAARFQFSTKNGEIDWRYASSSTPPLELGDPTTDTHYGFCVYDGAPTAVQPVLGSALPAGGRWTITNSGARYHSPSGGPDGLEKVKLSRSEAGRLSIRVRGAAHLALPLGQQGAVVAQLATSEGVCWTSTFSAPAERTSDRRFEDTSD